MKAEEIICLAILPDDIRAGIEYACQSLHYTFDRMQYGGDALKRFCNIALGKSNEATLLRFLRQHGIPHLSREGATPHTDPDRFDLRILNEIVDLKTFHISPAEARPEKLLQCLALVPNHHHKDQWRKRRKYQRFLFAFFTDRLNVSIARSRPAGTQGARVLEPGHVHIQGTPRILFLTAAPTIAECEARFAVVPADTTCTQYPGGTRIANMGCCVATLSSFQSFLNNMEQFRRR